MNSSAKCVERRLEGTHTRNGVNEEMCVCTSISFFSLSINTRSQLVKSSTNFLIRGMAILRGRFVYSLSSCACVCVSAIHSSIDTIKWHSIHCHRRHRNTSSKTMAYCTRRCQSAISRISLNRIAFLSGFFLRFCYNYFYSMNLFRGNEWQTSYRSIEWNRLVTNMQFIDARALAMGHCHCWSWTERPIHF